MSKRAHRGFGNILQSTILFYLYLESVWLLMGFLLFVPLTSSSLGLAGTNDIDWVSVPYFPGQGDLSYVFFG